MLYLAAALIFATGAAHSWLGERFILMRLFRRNALPELFGGTAFTKGTLRFAWHLTTVAWWGLGCVVIVAAGAQPDWQVLLRAVAVVGLVSSFFPLYFTRGRHLSWVAFLAVGVLLWLGAGGK